MSALKYATSTRVTEDIPALLQGLFKRLDTIDALCPVDQLPVYSVATSNDWFSSTGGSWGGGFWCGCWWLRALYADDVEQQLDYASRARAIRQQLANKLDINSVNRSMIFWPGCSLGYGIGENDTAEQLNQVASALAASFNPTMAAIPLGSAMGAGNAGERTISIDSLPSIIQILHLGKLKDQTVRERLQRHIDTLINQCFTSSGAWHTEKLSNGSQYDEISPAGHWCRGQAWGTLALALMSHHQGDDYIDKANHSMTYWWSFVDNGLAFNNISKQDHSAHDISAMLIMSVAALVLYRVTGELSLRQDAKACLRAAMQSRFIHWFDDGSAGFWGACGPTRQASEQMLETPWGIYWLIFCLMAHTGRIDPALC